MVFRLQNSQNNIGGIEGYDKANMFDLRPTMTLFSPINLGCVCYILECLWRKVLITYREV